MRESALLAVTELVTNAVVFGRPPIHVRAGLAGDVLTVEVSDQGEARPRRRVPSDRGGIGLNLVQFVADRVEIDPAHSRVRCEFDATATAALPTTSSVGLDSYAIERFRDARTLRVVLHGDIDIAASPELDTLFAELEPARLERVVIDLRDVAFVDTTGLRMAYRFDRWGREHDVDVVFTRPGPAVMKSFETAGLAFRLTFSDAR